MIRIERRYGRIGVDIRLRLPDGREVRERRLAPIQNELAAWKWARRRETFLMTGVDSGRAGCTLDHPGWIYFVQVESGAIKIGWSSALKTRLSQLQVSMHEGVTLLATTPGTLADEKRLHKQFADLRIRREWYRPGEALLTHIVKIGVGLGRDCGF